jgi:hypothetical protein
LQYERLAIPDSAAYFYEKAYELAPENPLYKANKLYSDVVYRKRKPDFDPSEDLAIQANLLAAGIAGPKKYEKDVFDPNWTPGQYTLKDWRARVAARQSAFGKTAETMGVYGPKQGLASNLSFAQGQTAEGASSDIADVADKNADIFNQFMGQETARKDQYNQLLAQNKGLRLAVRSDADKEFRNDTRQYFNNWNVSNQKEKIHALHKSCTKVAQRHTVFHKKKPKCTVFHKIAQIITEKM